MKRATWKAISIFLFFMFSIASSAGAADAGTTASQADIAATDKQNASEALKKLDQLIEQNRQLEKQNRELMQQIGVLRQSLAGKAGVAPEAADQGMAFVTAPAAPEQASEQRLAPYAADELEPLAAERGSSTWGRYTPNLGYKVANTEYGDMSISLYTYGRYLNQLGITSQYTDAFGNVKNTQVRQDFQLNKVQIKFLGWIMSPKFRYFLYAWSSNATQGQGAQVVLAGNVNNTFNKQLSVGAGIRSLPGTRSVEGNFPFWLGVDTRLIADEFFRPSYTSGVWAWGSVLRNTNYIAMIANNLSTLGVSAAQLPNNFSTFSGSFVWMPTTGEFGQGFGDFENHETLATRFGIHFTRSNENKLSQPNSDNFENTQLRLADGSIIFTPDLFGPGITITDALYRMVDFDSGLKIHGFSLAGEYFLRWLNNFQGPGTAGLKGLFDHGFQLQTSRMVVPKTLQIYAGGSTVFGQYGNPWDFRTGTNYFPFHNKVIRWNNEFLYLHKSPVGYTSVPFALGATGPIFHSDIELAF